MFGMKCTTTETMRMEVFRHFAKLHRLRTKRDACGDLIVPGKRGHVYEHSLDGKVFGILLMLLTKRRWTAARRKLALAGFTIRQNAETEGTALFDPDDSTQVRLALRLAGVKRRRVVSDEVRQRLAKAGGTLRNSKTPSQESELGGAGAFDLSTKGNNSIPRFKRRTNSS